ncbi:MAG: glutaredoxin 3 [Gammaproteobacteria bacterium]|nr:MAG: glutaredoxin 3 [Gammaproteobacteria bacterium]
MNKVVLYGTRMCPYCVAARRLLAGLCIDFEDISVDGDHQLREHMEAISGRRTVPQIWIGETHVGGFTELQELARIGKLETMLPRSE